MQHYVAELDAHARLCDCLDIPRLSSESLGELKLIIGDDTGARLVESVARLGNYGDSTGHAALRKAVSELAKKEGIHGKPGKRRRPELQSLVEDVAPVLLYLGLPMATGERSKLVRALRLLADHLGLSGDPRDALRKMVKDGKESQEGMRGEIIAALRRGLSRLNPGE